MKNIRVPYYLCLNDICLIDLADIGLDGFSDYLNLCVFTGYFKNYEELEMTLRKFGYLNDNENITSLSIIKQVGNKKDGYKSVKVSDRIVFRRELYLMKGQTLHNFFDLNKYNFDVMYYFFSEYRKNLIERKNKHIKNRTIDRRLEDQIILINRILPIAKKLKEVNDEYGNVNHQLIPPYYDGWIDEFIDLGIHFKRPGENSINEYGLINLACKVSELLNIDGVKKPMRTLYYDEVLKTIDEILKHKYSVISSSKIGISKESDEEDPDHYVFLESEDLDGIYPNDDKYKEVLEIQKDNLEEKKKKL